MSRCVVSVCRAAGQAVRKSGLRETLMRIRQTNSDQFRPIQVNLGWIGLSEKNCPGETARKNMWWSFAGHDEYAAQGIWVSGRNRKGEKLCHPG